MLPLFEMLNNAGQGQGVDQLARQFGISQAQAQEAMEALLPAFSQGLKRNAADPYGAGNFLGALASGQHAKYFEDAANAFSPQGVAEGNGILGHLFGSKDVSRAVASHAAQATGLGQDMLKQMLPVLASMLMGGLFKQSTGQMQGAQPRQAQAGGGGMLGDLMEQMMRQMGQQQPGAQPRGRGPSGMSPSDNPLGQILEGMFGGGSTRRGAPSGGQGNNPLGDIFDQFLRGGQGAGQPEPQSRRAPQPEPEANPSGRPRNPYDDLFGQMFETGRKTRDDYERGVENIFEQFRQGMERRR
ncbi:hypothetical protein A33O_16934 [Nitratireductor aquibiodomus RA22]|uniref:DUF937 domain-containing protein n=3 Tax=Nitratireductor aquibiodomus TaxID=204799 RepID=A0A1H4MAT8_9HYPH|nr:DUF937 domain-containing protein [Nitratireductor aquibiodomus]EIM73165.1 hypothetical protein A33O_16934 [Nitratireductor aquibiodomus RA22]SEB80149.1 hypothetical protein SAMN05216452_3231 [Nitratireductor aquibiodomus]